MKFFKRKKTETKTPEIDGKTYEFMLNGRAHGLISLWAAERMGKTSEGAANYTDEIVGAMMSDDALVAKLNEDLVFHEQHVEQQEIKDKLEAFKHIAKLELEDEAKMANNMDNC